MQNKTGFEALIYEWNADPAHWSNNKRRYHGLPVLRKQLNYKGRKYPPADVLLFHASQTMNELLIPALNKLNDQFAETSTIFKEWQEISNAGQNG